MVPERLQASSRKTGMDKVSAIRFISSFFLVSSTNRKQVMQDARLAASDSIETALWVLYKTTSCAKIIIRFQPVVVGLKIGRAVVISLRFTGGQPPQAPRAEIQNSRKGISHLMV
jgi:hypothetical protein